MIETWVFLLGIFATALICFVGGFAFGLFYGWKELQKDIEEKEITIKYDDRVFVWLDYILEIIDEVKSDANKGYMFDMVDEIEKRVLALKGKHE